MAPDHLAAEKHSSGCSARLPMLLDVGEVSIVTAVVPSIIDVVTAQRFEAIAVAGESAPSSSERALRPDHGLRQRFAQNTQQD